MARDTALAQATVRLLERLLFARRPSLVLLYLLFTLVLGWQALGLRPDAGFERSFPADHPWMRNLQRHAGDLGAPTTMLRIVVENQAGDIFDPAWLGVLRKVTEEVYYLRGIDRNGLRSLWTPNVRWSAIGESGLEGGAVMPDTWDGSLQSQVALRRNLMRSGHVGSLVADDFRSSIVEAPVFDRDPLSGKPLDYRAFALALEQKIRARYEQDAVGIHIAGFAGMAGELLGSTGTVLVFALFALAVTAVLLLLHTRCLAATLAPLLCSLLAVIWQLGLLRALGRGLDAWSLLVPFVVFAIGTSHGVQVIDAIGAQTLAGRARREAARHGMRALYAPGSAALAAAALGFATLALADIGTIRELGIAGLLGVAALVPANLVLLPVLMSYLGICLRGRQRIEQRARHDALPWRVLGRAATPRPAAITLVLAAAACVAGVAGARGLAIGAPGPGAQELREHARPNRAAAFIAAHYSSSAERLVVLVETAPGACYLYRNLERIDRFAWHMRNVPGVVSAVSPADIAREGLAAANEGSLKWAALSRDQHALDSTFAEVPPQLVNNDCSLATVGLALADRSAATLARVSTEAERFALANDDAEIRFVLAAGNAGIEAATDLDIAALQVRVLVLLHAAAAVLVLACFRSLAALVCIVLPLALGSVLCHALLARLGIALDAATLPLLALPVVLGIDYGIYAWARLQRGLRSESAALAGAWLATLRSSGAAIAVAAISLACGAVTWAWSPLRLQADWGMALGFSMLAEMLGMLWLLPALAYFSLRPPAGAPSRR